MTDTNPRDLLIEHDELLAKLSDVLWDAELGNTLNGLNNAARDVDAAMERLHNFLSQPEPEGPTDEEILALSHEHQVSYTTCDGHVIYPGREGCDMRDDVLSFTRALLARWGK